MYSQPDFLAKEGSCPVIVITADEVHFATAIDEFLQRAEHSKIAGKDGAAVFKPEVEQVAHDEERGFFTTDECQEIQQPPDFYAFFGRRGRQEVGVGYKVYWQMHSV